MARFPLAVPPGVVRAGTSLGSKGRYYDAWGVRWYPDLGPIGGWRIRKTDEDALTGAPRAARTWKDNGGAPWLAIGTHDHLYVTSILGAVFDITPTDSFTAGRPDATGTGGYGSGNYGASTYGTPRPGSSAILDATQWTLATWGEDLLAVSPDDGKLRQWDTSVGTGTVAATVTNSPACKAVCVTAERFVFALATADPRTVSWCDQEDNTDWTPSSTNQAGSFPLQTGGRLMCGQGVRGGTLLFTDLDVHLATYVGGTLVYDFERIGDACGAISRQAVTSVNEQAVWMSQNGFWQSVGGYVRQIPCDVWDYVFKDINRLQASKIWAQINSAGNGEVEFHYCSASSNEIDRCVVWAPLTGEWNIGRADRTCGDDRGAFQYPVQVSIDGYIYDHEVGWDYGDANPYATTGPLEIGNGDKIMHVMGLYPDDATLGDVTASFAVRRNPNNAASNFGPYSLAAQTDIRFSGSLLETTFTGAEAANWRVGTPKLELIPGEGR